MLFTKVGDRLARSWNKKCKHFVKRNHKKTGEHFTGFQLNQINLI